MSEPLLSVCLITYNHVKYIKEAIEGVLMQKVNFTWELIIADDCSTDGTREIVLEFKQKYPEFIKLIFQKKNVGPAKNWLDLITYPKSDYIAYIEGDDYWTDSNKLQKQVDFMEANMKYSFCFHNAERFNCKTGLTKPFNLNLKPGAYTTKDLLLKNWIVPSASLLFRNNCLPNPIPEWFKTTNNGDLALELVLSIKGNLFYFNEEWSVYRQYAINSITISKQNPIKYFSNLLLLYINLSKTFSIKPKYAIYWTISKARLALLKSRAYHRFPYLLKMKTNLLKSKITP